MRLLYLMLALCSFCVSADEMTYELLEAKGAKEFFSDNQGLMSEVMISISPEFAEHRAVVEAWEDKYFAWEKIREDLAPIYSERFNDDEIAELTTFFNEGAPEAFLETPTGTKFQALMPEISEEFTRFGYLYMQKVAPFLDDMLEDEKQL